jgi:hypothetical protein
MPDLFKILSLKSGLEAHGTDLMPEPLKSVKKEKSGEA